MNKLKKGEIIKYRVTDKFAREIGRKYNSPIGTDVFCLFISNIENNNGDNPTKAFVYYKVNNRISGYETIELNRVIPLTLEEQNLKHSFFNKVKVIDYKESAYVFGLRQRKKDCVGKVYENFKKYDNKESKKLGRSINSIIIETETGNMAFLHSECEYITPNLNVQPKKDKSFKVGRVIKYCGNNNKIDKTVPRTIMHINKPAVTGNARSTSIIVTEDKEGNIYKDYKKVFKIV